MKESFNYEEPVILSKEVIKSNIPDPETFHSSDRIFDCHFNNQFFTPIMVEVKWPNGSIEKVEDYIANEEAEKFVKGLKVFLNRVHQAHDSYWNTEISKTGNQFHRMDYVSSSQLEELDDLEKIKNGNFDENTKKIIHLAFDLYVTIQSLKPDRIVTLVNGALRLHSLCQALNFDSNNYLSIHRDNGRYDYRKDLPDNPVYEGELISSGSKVLLLEDTSSLMEDRTYKDARKWLEEKKVVDVPVFLERMVSLDKCSASYKLNSDEERIKIQDELNQEHCYNSFSIGEPDRKSSFWSHTHNPILRIIKDRPELYDEFFDFIKKSEK